MDLSRLNAEQRRRVLLEGDSSPLLQARLQELELRMTDIEKAREQEKSLRLPELINYFTKRIQRIETKLKLPKFKPKNPLASLKRGER